MSDILQKWSRLNYNLLVEVLPVLTYEQLIQLEEQLPSSENEKWWDELVYSFDQNIIPFLVEEKIDFSSKELYFDIQFQRQYPDEIPETSELEDALIQIEPDKLLANPNLLKIVPHEVMIKIISDLKLEDLNKLCTTSIDFTNYCDEILYEEYYRSHYPNEWEATKNYRTANEGFNFRKINKQIQDAYTMLYYDRNDDPFILYLKYEEFLYPEVAAVIKTKFRVYNKINFIINLLRLNKKVQLSLKLFKYLFDNHLGRQPSSWLLILLERRHLSEHIKWLLTQNEFLSNFYFLNEKQLKKSIHILIKYTNIHQLEMWLEHFEIKYEIKFKDIYEKEEDKLLLMEHILNTKVNVENAVFLYQELEIDPTYNNYKLLRQVSEKVKKNKEEYKELLDVIFLDTRIKPLLRQRYSGK